LDEVVARVAGLTSELLEEGVEPSRVAYVLVSVAADMGLQVCGDPLKVFPVLLGAIAQQAHHKSRADVEEENSSEPCVPIGATVH
jgi:hypothetical protein